ncbi:hypothetical protein Gotri_016280 [Gossypium trilobum]|uniref:Uncharacterized protein n=1 Tax=Gossypium trilobum TaxID=34281 RepID=A0A7J9E305_9ROSI|nr:hypothetical protein [Gossypium trilobum]
MRGRGEGLLNGWKRLRCAYGK